MIKLQKKGNKNIRKSRKTLSDTAPSAKLCPIFFQSLLSLSSKVVRQWCKYNIWQQIWEKKTYEREGKPCPLFLHPLIESFQRRNCFPLSSPSCSYWGGKESVDDQDQEIRGLHVSSHHVDRLRLTMTMKKRMMIIISSSTSWLVLLTIITIALIYIHISNMITWCRAWQRRREEQRGRRWGRKGSRSPTRWGRSRQRGSPGQDCDYNCDDCHQ